MVVQIPITIACGDYDRTRAIKDGRVPVEGCAVTYIPLEPEEVFFRAFRYQEFDVCELSFSSYLRVTDGGQVGLYRHPRLRLARVPPFRDLCPHRPRHPHAAGPEGQADRPAGIPDHRGGMDARHPAGRIRRQADRHKLALGRHRAARARRAHAARAHSRARSRSRSRATRRSRACSRAGEIDAMFSARAPSCFLRGRAPCRPALPRLPRGRAGLLPEDRALSDHASHRRAGRAWSSAIRGCPTSLYKAFCRGQGTRHGGGARHQRAARHAAVARGGVPRDDGAHGRGLLALWRRRRTARKSRRWRAMLTSRAWSSGGSAPSSCSRSRRSRFRKSNEPATRIRAPAMNPWEGTVSDSDPPRPASPSRRRSASTSRAGPASSRSRRPSR